VGLCAVDIPHRLQRRAGVPLKQLFRWRLQPKGLGTHCCASLAFDDLTRALIQTPATQRVERRCIDQLNAASGNGVGCIGQENNTLGFASRSLFQMPLQD
jgi:hypothetical protein